MLGTVDLGEGGGKDELTDGREFKLSGTGILAGGALAYPAGAARGLSQASNRVSCCAVVVAAGELSELLNASDRGTCRNSLAERISSMSYRDASESSTCSRCTRRCSLRPMRLERQGRIAVESRF